jgi:hypothetical protein
LRAYFKIDSSGHLVKGPEIPTEGDAVEMPQLKQTNFGRPSGELCRLKVSQINGTPAACEEFSFGFCFLCVLAIF